MTHGSHPPPAEMGVLQRGFVSGIYPSPCGELMAAAVVCGVAVSAPPEDPLTPVTGLYPTVLTQLREMALVDFVAGF